VARVSLPEGDRFLAAGVDIGRNDADAAIWLSRDGRDWERVDSSALGGPGDQRIDGITVAGNKVIAVGFERVGDETDAAVWRSSDGRNWALVTRGLDEPGNQFMNRVAGTTVGLIAVGVDNQGNDQDAAVWVSTDAGASWARAPDPTGALGGRGNQQASRLAKLGDRVLVVGSDSAAGDLDAAVWSTNDATTWRRVESPALSGSGDQLIADVAQFGDGLAAAGSDTSGGDADAAVWLTSDGDTWERMADPTAALGGPGDQLVNRVVAPGSPKKGAPVLFLGGVDEDADGQDAAVWTSVDGTTLVRERSTSFGGSGDQLVTSISTTSDLAMVVGVDSRSGTRDAAVWLGVTPSGAAGG